MCVCVCAEGKNMETNTTKWEQEEEKKKLSFCHVNNFQIIHFVVAFLFSFALSCYKRLYIQRFVLSDTQLYEKKRACFSLSVTVRYICIRNCVYVLFMYIFLPFAGFFLAYFLCIYSRNLCIKHLFVVAVVCYLMPKHLLLLMRARKSETEKAEFIDFFSGRKV